MADWTSHIDLVAGVVKLLGCESYLEIGCQDDFTFSRVEAARKVGVDPDRGGTLRMTSDTYFEQFGETFDAIFIDGNHHHAQVFKDAQNALRMLRPGGILMLHDCAPPDAAHEASHLCGTAWRAFVRLRGVLRIDGIVADWDYGTGIFRDRSDPHPIERLDMDELRWTDLVVNRKRWLRPSSPEQVRDWLK